MEDNQILGTLLIAVTLILVLITTNFLRRGRLRPTLRPIAAYDNVPRLVGLSIEASRPIHLSIGSSGIGDESTLLAIASAELAYQVTVQTAIGDASPILTMTNTSAIPLGQDTLRRAYQSRDLVERYSPNNVRWYPTGSRSLAFAAAITALIADDNTAGSVLGGSYGPELALILDASQRRNQYTIAVSDQLEGQAIAYALADDALIGEEIFAAGSYLDGGSVQMAESVVVDILRWLVIIGIIVGFIVGFLD